MRNVTEKWVVESDLDGKFDQFTEFWRLFRSLQVV